MYVERNIDVRPSNHCFRAETKSTTDSECVFAAIVIQQTTRMRRTIMRYVVCPALYNIFPHYLIKARFSEKNVLEIKYVYHSI